MEDKSVHIFKILETCQLTESTGRGRMEDPVAMLRAYPLMNDYWRDKRARIDRIKVPAFILASYSTFLHLPGSLRGYEEITHEKKWYAS